MSRARYRNLVDALVADIRSGKLPPGSRLPTHRELAAREGLALVTASRVYAELAAMGLVSGEVGRGTFVRDSTVPPSHGVDQLTVATGIIDMNFNNPAVGEQGELLRKALRELSFQGDIANLLRYQPHAGRPRERAVIADHLRARGLTVQPERVMVVSGAQHGLAVTVLGLLRPGDVVAVDALTYPGFTVLAQAHHLELAPLPAGTDGADLDALESLCAAGTVRAVYTMPTMQNPLSWISSLRWRERLVDIARRHDLLVIEDAAYAFLADDPPPPLAALLPNSTIYLSGLSKSVGTGLRFGFLSAPAELVGAIERAIRATTWNTPPVITAIATSWLEDGTVTRLEAAKRDDARLRNAIARKALADHRPVGHPSSYILWLPLPAEVRSDQVVADLLRDRIAVSSAKPFATTAHTPQALRLALASADVDDLDYAVRRIVEIVDDHSHR
ncbi:GntR family transcriptional regulator [Mycolicibacterium litorale]|nr:GntR family transcriptional regulator [Mycolicibacterium litorale]